MNALRTAAASALLYGTVYVLERQLAFAPPSWLVIMAFVVVTLAQFLAYGHLLTLARAADAALVVAGRDAATSMASGRPVEHAVVSSRGLFVGAVLIWIGMAITPPVLSMDVFSYLAHGHQLSQGVNPYAVETREVGREAYGQALAAWGWLPVHEASPYGPLWTHVERWSFAADASVRTQMLWMKAAVVLAGLVTALFIWLTLGRVAPQWRLFGTTLFLWNPLVIHEVAGGGHNDAMMLVFCVGGLYLFARGRDGLGTAAVCSAALVKLTALVVTPPLAFHLLRAGLWRADGGPAARRAWRHAVLKRLAAAALAVTVMAVAGWWLYGDLWLGRSTFTGLRLHAEPNIAPSTGGTLYYWLTRDHSEAGSARVVSMLLNGLLVAAIAVISTTATWLQRTFTACASLSVVVLLLASSYWPWYVVTPVALCALAPWSRVAMPVAVTFSFFGRLVAPIDRLRLNGLMDWPLESVLTTIVGLWLPAAIVVLVLLPVLLANPSPWRSTALRPVPR